MRTITTIIFCLLLALPAFGGQAISVREIRYDGQLSDSEARFGVDLDLEVTGKGEGVLTLFDGEVAVLTTKLPENIRLVREGNVYRAVVGKEGRYKFKLDVVAKINRQEPWNKVLFTGPVAALGSITAQAKGTGLDLQLLSGMLQEAVTKDGMTRVRGILGPDWNVAVRWQSKATEVARKALLTCDTAVTVQVTPTVVKYKTDLKYEILQGAVTRLTVTLPAAQTLTKLQAAEGVRDWAIRPAGVVAAVSAAGGAGGTAKPPGTAATTSGEQILTVEFIKPVEKTYALTLLSEQTVESAASTAAIVPPQPLEVERESGALTIAAEDVLVETESANGVRQVNATGGALSAYQFYSRPFTLALRLRRIEPVVNVNDRVTARLEEARLLVNHALTLSVEKAGIYVVELVPQKNFVVADVRGEGVEDWKSAAGKVTVNFNSRVLGSRRLEVQLEQAFRSGTGILPVNDNLQPRHTGETPVPLTAFPAQLVIEPLRVTGAVKETAQVGAAGAPGIQLKTVSEGLTGIREIPINRLANRADEALAYNADQADWKLTLTAERMAARITADVFNLITIGDGLLGGSATLRFAIINQGVQEFRVKVPTLWKNVEFTGPNIRRKELQGDVWVIGLQEKAWGGYTLVVTYDYQFDPHKATLPIGGIHPDGVERETGSVALTSAANLQLAAQPNGDALRRVDEAELSATDRALITRPVLIAYKYQGPTFGLALDVNRFDELPVLDAAADRTQLTTVLTEEGQMLTQASFMVKNNDRQFQTFTLPEGADFWSCYVSGEATKPEKNGAKLLVPLPRRANRDEAFAVDIVYAQKIDPLKSLAPRSVALVAPQTDMQTTYAEWELYVPPTHDLANFGGNMIVARGTTYGVHDAWLTFCRFYDALYRDALPFTIMFLVVAGLVFLVVMAIRRGWRGAVAVVSVVVVLLVLAAMMLPALNSAREKGRRISSMSNLRQIGMALGMWADGHGGQLPASFDELKGITSNEKLFYDVETGGKFEYAGSGKKWQEEGGDKVIAYSPADRGEGRNVLFSDGHVEWMTSAKFGDALSRTVTEKPVGSTASDSKLVPLKVTPAKPMFVGTPKQIKSPNLEPYPGAVPPATTPAPPSGPGGGGWHAGVAGETKTSAGTLVLTGENLYRGATTYGLNSAATAVTVAGIRPIRIDIPKAGTRFVFTKVLNVGQKQLAVQALALDLKAFRIVRGSAQALALLAGLAWLTWLWWRKSANSVALTLALALAAGSVVSWLLSVRLLGEAMIAAVPVVGLAVGVWFVKKFWKREKREVKSENGGTPPPVIAAVAILLAASSVEAGSNFSSGASKSAVEAAVPGSVAAKVTAGTAVATPASASIISATYTGMVKAVDGPTAGRVVAFEGAWELETSGTNQTVRLLGSDVAVEEFSGPGGTKRSWWSSAVTGGAKLVRDGESVGVLLPQPGKASVRMKFLVKLAGDVAKRQITFGIPPALVSRVAITLDEPEAMVEVPQAVTVKTTQVGAGVPPHLGEKPNPHPDPLPSRRERGTNLIPSPPSFGGEGQDEGAGGKGKIRGKKGTSVPAEGSAKVGQGEGSAGSGQTLVEAVFGAADKVELTWTPRMKRAAEIATTVFCQNASLVTFGGGVVNVRSVLDYQVTQSELRQMQVKLPVGQRLMRVEGDGIRTWKLDGPVVSVELMKGVAPSYRLTVETESVAAPVSGASVGEAAGTAAATPIQIPHAADVKRETGIVALKASEELGLTVETQNELQKVDIAEFMKSAMSATNVATAYRFLKPEFALSVKVEPMQSQMEAVVRNHLHISPDQLTLKADVAFTIKRAGVFALRVALPEGYRVERVDAGTNFSQWIEKDEKSEERGGKREAGRVLELTLKEWTLGFYMFTVQLVKTLKELPKSVEAVGVQPLDVQKATGFVAVSAEEGVQIKSEAFDGLTEVPAALVPAVGNAAALPATGVLAFKLIPSESGTGILPVESDRHMGKMPMPLTWKLSVATEKIESWVRAEVMNTLTLTETLISGRSLVRYDVANAPSKEFRVRVPATFKNVEVTGTNIRRKDRDEATGEWRVELQNKVRGTYTLTVTWDQPWNVREGALELLGLEAAGVERETGALAVVAPPRLKLEPKSVTPDLLKVDVRDLPEWAERSSEPPVLTYRYLRPGYKLALTAQRFEEAEVLQALVDNVKLTTVVSEDGQMMTEMALAVRNNARQYLEVKLPEGAQVWSAFVAGQPVRPSQRAGKVLLPMERSSGDAPVAVELTYVSAGRFPEGSGAVGLVSPALDVPLKNARWELFLPPDYRYGPFEGSMKRDMIEVERTVAAVASAAAREMMQTFSMDEYAQAEADNRKARDAEVSSSLSNVRSQLSANNPNEAYNYYRRAQKKMSADETTKNAELQQLGKELRQTQARNFLSGNNAYIVNSGGQVNVGQGQQINAPVQQWGTAASFGGGALVFSRSDVAQQPQAQQQAGQAVQWDEQVAEQQVAKVQQAQEVTVAKTLPLRVNLPKRGVHFTFSQVLQTEIGKPMSVGFTAVNDRAANWPVRVGASVGGLALLWALVNLAVRRKTS